MSSLEVLLKSSSLVEMSSKMRSLDREVRGLKMEKEDIERVSSIFFSFVLEIKILIKNIFNTLLNSQNSGENMYNELSSYPELHTLSVNL